MLSVLLISSLIAALHCVSGDQDRCKARQLFCISTHLIPNKQDEGYDRAFEMHFKIGSNDYTTNELRAPSKIVIRNKGSATASNTIKRSTHVYAFPYFLCDGSNCKYDDVTRMIDDALKSDKLVNYIHYNTDKLEYVLENSNQNGVIVRHQPDCTYDNHALIAAFCIDRDFRVTVSVPMPVLTDKSLQLQKGDQFIIPSYSYTAGKRSQKQPKQTIEWVGIKKRALIKFGRTQWKHTVGGEDAKREHKTSVVKAINDALQLQSKPIELIRDGKVIFTITKEGGLQEQGTVSAWSEYDDMYVMDGDDVDVFAQGYEAGYRAAERLLRRFNS
eukprot:1084101_1